MNSDKNVIPWWAVLVGTFIAALILFAVTGCASMDYDWQHTRPASVKPWLYVEVKDPNRTCNDLAGALAQRDRNTIACSQWRPVNCIIYLTPNAPAWIVAHEERHCEGWIH